MSKLALVQRRPPLASVLVLLCISLNARGAQAQDSPWGGGGGTFVGVAVGSEGVRVAWGFEAYATIQLAPVPGGCSTEDRSRAGSLLQLRMKGIEPQLTLAGLGVLENDRAYAAKSASAELGYTYRFKDRRSGLHTGIAGDLGFIAAANVALRHEFFLGDTFATGGLRFFPVAGPPEWCVY